VVIDVRGVGLAIGVEVAARATAAAIKEGLRERGVLIGTAGREGNVLKVRPPLAFSDADILVFVDALASTLGSIAAR
jgi:4-aminobutyrate aminotransferase-like enzyme